MNDLLQQDAPRTDIAPTVERMEPNALLPTIVALAKDPAVDVTKLQALLDMQERMEARAAERAFARALTRIAGQIPQIEKNGVIDLGQGKGKIPFAKWEDMDAAIRPILNAEGLTLSFNSKPKPGDGGGMTITGRLLHEDGHFDTTEISLALDSGPGRNNLQAMGSTLSYGKRYCAEMLLNIVRKGQDDDGRAGGAKYASAAQVAEIDKLLTDTKADRPRFMQMFAIAELKNLTEQSYVAAKNMLSARAAKPQGGTQ